MNAEVSFVGLVMHQVTYRESAHSAVNRYFLCHAEDKAHALEQATNAYPGAVIVDASVLSYKCAESIIGDDPQRFDGTEVHGVRNLYAAGHPEGTCCEVDEENPEFFSAYVHCKAGGVECIGDFGTRALALQYAQEIQQKYRFVRS